MVEPAQPAPGRRRVLLVVGGPRSGADLLTGTLSALGMGEPHDPAWLTDLSAELFARSSVVHDDARPEAWYATGRLGQFERLRIRVSTWLEEQLAALDALVDDPEVVRAVPELVLDDPCLAWYAALWRSAAMRCGATPSFALVVGSGPAMVVEAAGGSGPSDAEVDRYAATRATASWLNLVLHTERATRGSARVVVRRRDLLDDWTRPLFTLGRALDLAAVQEATANEQRAVHTLLEPARAARAADRAATATWADLVLPPRLREIAEATEAALDALVETPDSPEVCDRLDALRVAYTELHAEAAALTDSGMRAAHAAGARAATEAGGWPFPWMPASAAPTAPTSPGTSPRTPAEGVRRGAERVPHRVRALVPPRVRRGLRRAADRAAGRARDGRGT